MIIFWRRWRTLKGSLGWTGMEIQTMVGRPSLFFSIKKTNKILAVRLKRLFWARKKVECSFFLWILGLTFGGFTLWLSKSRGCESSDFGCGFWKLHTMPDRRLRFLYFISYSQPISLDSQQSLAIQSHDLSTSMAIVWSGPYWAFSPSPPSQ